MKKFLNSVTGRYVIFGLCLFLVVIAISFFEAQGRITVNFTDTAVEISSNKYNMLVKYELIESVELMDMPDRGDSKGGNDDASIRIGEWNNDVWGDYTVLAIPHATNCIVLHLNDGRTFVFNARSNDYTAELFAQLQSHLAG